MRSKLRASRVVAAAAVVAALAGGGVVGQSFAVTAVAGAQTGNDQPPGGHGPKLDAAAQALLRLTFTSHQSRELLGYGDITMNMAAGIIGHEIGNPDLRYAQVSDEQMRSAMLQMGLSEDFAGQILEMCAALNSGHMRALEARDDHNTTPTYFEKFVHQDFLPRYLSRVGAAA